MEQNSAKFYDTCALLNISEKAFEDHFYISLQTLIELESIKISATKDEAVKYDARIMTRLLDEHDGDYTVVSFYECADVLGELGLPDTPDNRILSCAYRTSKQMSLLFVTDDLSAKNLARNVFGLTAVGTDQDCSDSYVGAVEVKMDEETMADFYSNLTENTFGLKVNQYMMIQNKDGECVDVRRWDGEEHVDVSARSVKSMHFDPLKPRDVYQRCAIDSIMSNQVTAITGKAGSGKTLIGLSCAMSLVEAGKYQRVVMMYNAQPVKGSAKIGFLPGDKNEKAKGMGIGNVLASKFGDSYAIDNLISADKLRLYSMSDIRGFETNDILFITEAQNCSIDLLRLCLERAGDGAKVIFEGDFDAQVDSPLFAGRNNGMRRAIDTFGGTEIFGHVELKNIWRSRIAEIAYEM